MSEGGINWSDIAYMSGTGINWDDMGVTSNAGVNWSNLAAMTSANINWNDIAYLADNAQLLVTNVNTILGICNTLNSLMGDPGDVSTTDTLFGRMKLLTEVTGTGTNLSADIETILATVATLEENIGTANDDSSASTVFGDLKEIEDYVDTLETLVGASGDTTDESVFGELSKLAEISELVDKAKSGAEGALGEASGIRKELGAKGMTPNVYEKLNNLDSAMEELKIASETISESQLETGNLASEMLSKLSDVVSESAKSLGVEGMSVEPLSSTEAEDLNKVHQKLAEINTKLDALRESVGKQDVVVKSWFESSE